MPYKTKAELLEQENVDFGSPLWKEAKERLVALLKDVTPQQMYVHFMEACLTQRDAMGSARTSSRPSTATSKSSYLSPSSDSQSVVDSRPSTAVSSRSTSGVLRRNERIDRTGFILLCRHQLKLSRHEEDGIHDRDLTAIFNHIESWDKQFHTISAAQWVKFVSSRFIAQAAYPDPEFKLVFNGEVPGVGAKTSMDFGAESLSSDPLEDIMTLAEMKQSVSAATPKSAELMLKHGVITEEEFEALDIPMRALTPAFRKARRKRLKEKRKLLSKFKKQEEERARLEAEAAEAERQMQAKIPHISERQPAPKWLVHMSNESFDDHASLKFEQRIRKSSRKEQNEAPPIDFAENIPDRFFQLPSDIVFEESHVLKNSRYFQRLSQHQARQRKYIHEAKRKHMSQWYRKMATVFPSFGMKSRLKKFQADDKDKSGGVTKIKSAIGEHMKTSSDLDES